MWKEKLLILLSSLTRTQIISIALFLLGFVLLSGGLIYSLRSGQVSNEITFEPSGATSKETSENKISVDIEGAVINPNVYSLSPSARVKDGLIAAGGLASNADREWIAKNLNLALKLSDSAKIYIPKIGEAPARNSTASNTVSLTGLININSASASELDSLPGIGAATAQKIIDNRPYSKIEDLTLKKIMTSKVFDKIKDKIGIY